jgi:hypothetical protein
MKPGLGFIFDRINGYLASTRRDGRKRLLKRHSQIFHQIGDDQRSRTRDAGHAVHQNVGLLSRLMNKVSSCTEVHAQIISLMVLARNVEGVRHVLFRVPDVNVFASCQQRADVVL